MRRGAQRIEHARKDKGIAESHAEFRSRRVDRRCAGEDSRHAAFSLRRTSSCLERRILAKTDSEVRLQLHKLKQKSLMDGLL